MKKKVKLLLRENVEKLGLAGDEVTVSVGYAKNRLIPNNLVLTKNDPQYLSLIKKIKEKRVKIKKELEEFKKVANKLSGEIITFVRKASSTGKLFGSVTSEDIAKELKIDKKLVENEPIKSLGNHKVDIKGLEGINSQVIVKIEAEKSLDKVYPEQSRGTRDKEETKSKK